MHPKVAKFLVGSGILVLTLAVLLPLRAQVTGATLSGAITDSTGKAVVSANITVKNVATNQSVEAQADATGHYSVPNLTPGDYEVSVSALGFGIEVSKVTVAAGAAQTMNVQLSSALSLTDLGFSPDQTQGSAQDQARLDKRSHMLKIHQELGLIAAIPLFASVASGPFAGGRTESSASRDLHAALGSTAADLYFTSAWFAIRAPKIPGTKVEGPIRFHKAMAWIHGPGMILTPILGAVALYQTDHGEKVHGIAAAHGTVGIITAAAYGAAILSVTFKW